MEFIASNCLFLGFESVLKHSFRTFFKIDTYDDKWLVALEEKGQSMQNEDGQTTPYGLLMVYNKTLNLWRCVNVCVYFYFNSIFTTLLTLYTQSIYTQDLPIKIVHLLTKRDQYFFDCMIN